jgi:hypothetical protein
VEVGDETNAVSKEWEDLIAPMDPKKNDIDISNQETQMARTLEYKPRIFCPRPTKAWEYRKLLNLSWTTLLAEVENIYTQIPSLVVY